MKITFLGGGNMARALIGGLLQQGFTPAQIHVVEVRPEGRESLTQAFGVRCHAAPAEDAMTCDTMLLAVKPQQMREALAPVAGKLQRQLVISIAAGIRLSDISRWAGGHRVLVRAMPNTPALIGAGITGLYADPSVGPDQRADTERILGSVGKTVWVDDEGRMDAVTAISGSGPAYVFYLIEALRDAALELGFDAESARLLAMETFRGATMLAAASDEDVGILRERVTSKGGTTEAALKSMAADGVAEAIRRAVRAAQSRGRELGDMLGRD